MFYESPITLENNHDKMLLFINIYIRYVVFLLYATKNGIVVIMLKQQSVM